VSYQLTYSPEKLVSSVNKDEIFVKLPVHSLRFALLSPWLKIK